MGLQLFYNSRKKIEKQDNDKKTYPGFISRVLSNVVGKIVVYILIMILLIFFFDYIILILEWLIFRWF